jgi:UDPglucose 6-dehydrogenase
MMADRHREGVVLVARRAPRPGEDLLRVTVIGLGYVGLVTAACLSEWGHETTGVDADVERLDGLRAGRMPIHEPGLADLIASGEKAGRLTFVGPSPAAVASAEIVFVAVGTHDGNGGWQTTTIRSVLADVVPSMADDATLVVRSTLPPDFIRQLPWLVTTIRQEAGRPAIPVMTNPEFTKEGTAIRDFLEPDRVVIGIGDDQHGRGETMLRRLYRNVGAPVLVMGATDAALTKLGANLFLATKISFANELAQLCDAYGADVTNVVAGMAHDSRIGGGFLRPGIGFGGSCLPHQVTMTVRDAGAIGLSTPLFAAVDEVNSRQRRLFVERVAAVADGLQGTAVAMLGLTFKPDTDDLREAPSLDVARMLLDQGATVVAYDPMPAARAGASATVPGLVVVDDAMKAVVGADVVGILTEWPEFVDLPWSVIAKTVRRAAIVDGRNCLSPHAMTAAGFRYVGFGRDAVSGVAASDVMRGEPQPVSSELSRSGRVGRRRVVPAHATASVDYPLAPEHSASRA